MHQCIHLIAPSRANRRATQDGRELRRYQRRWLSERFWAWLQSLRRIAVLYEYCVDNYLALSQLGCPLFFMREILRWLSKRLSWTELHTGSHIHTCIEY